MKQSEMAGPASSKRVQLSTKDFFIDTGCHEHLLARNFRNIYRWRDRLLFTNPMIVIFYRIVSTEKMDIIPRESAHKVNLISDHNKRCYPFFADLRIFHFSCSI